MESKKDEKPQDDATAHPKPTDEMQLEIETVIPSTEKGETAESATEKDDHQPISKQDVPGSKEKSGNKPGAEKKESSTTADEKNDDKPNDIETITPDA